MLGSMTTITNPVLPGFHPDPCLLRVGGDYYLATSTFEWWPGVAIHHSRDLVHWRLASRPLDEPRLLDLTGAPDSGGIWAPCLTHARGRFWLVYTPVLHQHGACKDTPNYLTSAPSIDGPWDDPVFLNASGFDPSLFHDDDGRMWVVNMRWDHRPGRTRFNGILLQEYDPVERRLTGPIHRIFTGTSLRVTEGPHLYRRDGWYYLVTAEGGTGWNHAVTVARSRDITGPYEVHPQNPLLTSKDRPDLVVQKAGHGSWIEAADGSWWLAHLMARPVGPQRRCILGRETALQRLAWGEDGWPRLAQGGNAPAETVPGPDLPAHPWPTVPTRLDFTGPDLHPVLMTLRTPADPSWLSLRERPGHLRLRGRESPFSCFRQSVVGRRLTSVRCRATCEVQAVPEDFQQMAGLMAFYDTEQWYYLRLTHDEERGRIVSLAWADLGAYDEHAEVLAAPGDGPVRLRFDLDGVSLRFFADVGQGWVPVGPDLDATKLSDDHFQGSYNFTGAFAALAAHDLSGRALPADVAWFSLEDLPA